VAEDTPADALGHAGVPPHEGFQGGCVRPVEEALQQLPVSHPRPIVPQRGTAKIPEDLVQVAARHVVPSEGHAPSTVYYRCEAV
jgi:hypothetical protein